MSLISLRNVLEPVTNKVHLITIFLLALIFVVLRLSNGGIQFETRVEQPRLMRGDRAVAPASSESNKRIADMSPDEILGNNPGTLGKMKEQEKSWSIKSNKRATAPAREGFLDSIMEPVKKKAPAKPAATPRRGGLDDIERELGLR